jgi:hypothetical protein
MSFDWLKKILHLPIMKIQRISHPEPACTSPPTLGPPGGPRPAGSPEGAIVSGRGNPDMLVEKSQVKIRDTITLPGHWHKY